MTSVIVAGGFGNENERYERYLAWCELLGVLPAEKDDWKRGLRAISDFTGKVYN